MSIITDYIAGTGHHYVWLGALVNIVTLLPLTGIGLGRSYRQEVGNDVTEHVENLGNPFSTIGASGFTALGRGLVRGKNRRAERIYARNIWDMHVYDGRLYLGAGNGSDSGPAPNAGPVPIICYDPAKEDFVKEGTVLDEQIDVYYTHRGRLYIPGHDPIQSWKFGNFYRRQDDGRWKKYRNIPDGIHLYAMTWRKGKLFGALGTPPEKGGGAVCISSDEGQTWKVVHTGSYRVYSLLTIADALYAVETIPGGRASRPWVAKWLGPSCVYEFVPPDRFVPREDMTASILFPQTDVTSRRLMKLVRVQSLEDRALYIGASCNNDHQFLPFGLYVASSLQKQAVQVRRVPLPGDSQPWDLLVRDDRVYVLLESKAGDDIRVKVLRSPTEDLRSWDEVLCFTAPTFARSFEVLGGDFYFGLGTEIKSRRTWKQEDLHPATGDILRVKAVFVKPPPAGSP